MPFWYIRQISTTCSAAAAEAMTMTDAFGRISVQQVPSCMVAKVHPQHQHWPQVMRDVIDPSLQQMVYVPQTVVLVRTCLAVACHGQVIAKLPMLAPCPGNVCNQLTLAAANQQPLASAPSAESLKSPPL